MADNHAQNHRDWVLAALDEFEAPLTLYARRLVRDQAAAQDVVQHVFLRLCDQHAHEIGDRLPAWLFRVCRNRSMDWLRRQKGKTHLSGFDYSHEGNGGCFADPTNSLTSREQDPAKRVEEEDFSCWLQTPIGLTFKIA